MKIINKLQIGCGLDHFNQLDGWANLDISKECNPDILHDIRKGLPMFADNSLDEIVANGVLEMILPNEEFVFVLNELWRTIKPNGRLMGQVPSIDSRVLMLDPFDRRWFQKGTFNYWKNGSHEWQTFGKLYGFKPWDIINLEINDNGIVCFEQLPSK